MSDLQYFSAGALTLVLLVAGVAKLRSPQRFRGALDSYGLIPDALVTPLVYAVPVVELASAALQWVPALQPQVSIGIAAMFVAFTLLLLGSLLRHEDADCGCFGTASPEKVSWFSIARNGALIALAVAGVPGAGGDGGARVPATLAGMGAGLLVLVLDQALTMLSRPNRPVPRG